MLSPGTETGHVWAVSAETGDDAWRHEQRAGVMSMVATGGGLVFGGDVAGNFTAYDDETGDGCGRRTSGRDQRLSRSLRRRRQAVCRRDDGLVGRVHNGAAIRAGVRPGADRPARVRVRAAVRRYSFASQATQSGIAQPLTGAFTP